jgi:hypothetical protein
VDLDSGAGLLHRLTSYDPEREWDVPADDLRLRHDLVPSDPDTLPPQVKGYPASFPVTPLPRDLPRPGVSATAVLAGAPIAPQVLDLAQLWARALPRRRRGPDVGAQGSRALAVPRGRFRGR